MPSPHLILAAVTLAILAAGADAPPVSFRAEVAPILVRKCQGCHNAKKPEGGLDITTFALLKAGGEKAGDLILEPGDPDASHLIELVRPGGAPRMPYKLPPLSAREIGTLERWIQQGAKFDGPSETETPIASLVDPLAGLPKVALKVPAADPVTALAYTPDGKTLAAAVGRRVLLFDAIDGETEGDPGRPSRPGHLAADHPRRRHADRRRRAPRHVRLGHGLGPRQGLRAGTTCGAIATRSSPPTWPRMARRWPPPATIEPSSCGISPGVSNDSP